MSHEEIVQAQLAQSELLLREMRRKLARAAKLEASGFPKFADMLFTVQTGDLLESALAVVGELP